MKILHTSDWHLGKKLGDFSRITEQIQVLDEICQIADDEGIDVVLVAGDIFDSFNPPVEAIELLYKTLKRLSNEGKRAVIAIAGNHDSADRIESPDPLARECGIIFTGYPSSLVPLFELNSGLSVIKNSPGYIELKLPGFDHHFRIILTPYANELRLKMYLGENPGDDELRQLLGEHWKQLALQHFDNQGINFMISHLFVMEKNGFEPEESEDEKSILFPGGTQAIFTENLPDNLQYCALGHLHRFQGVQHPGCPVIYSGSPVAYSFSEANQDKCVVIIEGEPGQKVKIKRRILTQGKKLLRATFHNVTEAIAWLEANKNSLIELTMVTDNYLTQSELSMIRASNNGIISIIPQVTENINVSSNKPGINPGDPVDDLFEKYFISRNNMPPNLEIMELLREIVSTEEEE